MAHIYSVQMTASSLMFKRQCLHASSTICFDNRISLNKTCDIKLHQDYHLKHLQTAVMFLYPQDLRYLMVFSLEDFQGSKGSGACGCPCGCGCCGCARGLGSAVSTLRRFAGGSAGTPGRMPPALQRSISMLALWRWVSTWS